MPGITPDAQCPHCGTVQNLGTLAQHVRLCLADPDVRRRVLLALTDPADPTRAVSGKRYNARRSMFNAPGDATLLKQYGDTWAAVCAEYGLQTPLPYYKTKPPKEPAAPQARRKVTPKAATCPHCGLESTAPAMGRHVPICVKNSKNYDRYKELMTAHDDVGVTYSEYEARVIEHGAPAVTTLRRMTGMMAWDDLLAWFGLQPADAPAAMRTCPVCGQTFKALGYAHHYKACGGNAEAVRMAQEVEGETALVRYERRVLAYDEIAAQCLPVARVVDLGNGYVRCVLR